MRVFVAGATGVLGRRAVAALVAAGHEVTALVRSPEKAALARALGATPVAGSLFDPDALRASVAGHDAVCNLATHIPPLARVMYRAVEFHYQLLIIAVEIGNVVADLVLSPKI